MSCNGSGTSLPLSLAGKLARRAASRVANAVNDELNVFGLVEDHIRVRIRNGTAESGPIRHQPAVWMLGKNVNGRMYTLLDVLGPARRALLDIIEDGG